VSWIGHCRSCATSIWAWLDWHDVAASSVVDLLEDQEKIFQQLARLRHAQRLQERASMSRHSRVRIVRTTAPVIGELRWSVLPLDLKTQGQG